jgi:hypothetical protein
LDATARWYRLPSGGRSIRNRKAVAWSEKEFERTDRLIANIVRARPCRHTARQSLSHREIRALSPRPPERGPWAARSGNG